MAKTDSGQGHCLSYKHHHSLLMASESLKVSFKRNLPAVVHVEKAAG